MSNRLLLGEHYDLQTFEKGSLFTHQRVCNKPFGFLYDIQKQNMCWKDYRLFWTSPGNKCYFPDTTFKYTLEANRDLKGISLLTSPSDIDEILSREYKHLTEYSDSFVNAWFAILHDNVLGFPVDFINCYDHEIIFAKHGEFLNIIKEDTEQCTKSCILVRRN